MNSKNGLLKSILPWLLVLIVIGGMVTFMNQTTGRELKYNEFVEVVQEEKIKEVEIVPSSLVIDVSGSYTKKMMENHLKCHLQQLFLIQKQRCNR